MTDHLTIEAVEPVLLTVPLPPEAVVRWSGGILTSAHIALVRVRLRNGDYGLGEVYAALWAPDVVAAVVRHFGTAMLGKSAASPAAVWQEAFRANLYWSRNGIGLAVLGGVETALWDALGKARGVPVYELLGGAMHERLDLYASAGLEGPPEVLADEVRRYRDQGFGTVKIRAGFGAARDRARVEAARETLGPDIGLAVDLVQGHHPSPMRAHEAGRRARLFEPFDLAWLEEPCGNNDWPGYRQVRATTRIPISGGESSAGLFEFRHIIDTGAVDIVQPDVTHAGGVSEMVRIATYARAKGVQLIPHVWGAGVGMMANYHVSFATPDCHLAEYPTWQLPVRDELLTASCEPKDGELALPDVPGLGVELRPETEARYPYRPGQGVEMRGYE